MDKQDAIYVCVHTHDGILLSYKKGWNVAICQNMGRLGGYYAKWSKTEKDKYCMLSLIGRT